MKLLKTEKREAVDTQVEALIHEDRIYWRYTRLSEPQIFPPNWIRTTGQTLMHYQKEELEGIYQRQIATQERTPYERETTRNTTQNTQ